MLQILDQRWKEHLASMDYLRQSIHLRAYAQKQPKQEYKRESFELFQELLASIKRDVIQLLCRVQIEAPSAAQEAERRRREAAAQAMRYSHAESSALEKPDGSADGQADQAAAKAAPFVRPNARSGATNPAPAAPGGSTSNATGGRLDGNGGLFLQKD